MGWAGSRHVATAFASLKKFGKTFGRKDEIQPKNVNQPLTHEYA
jgi:hypothetical protein